MTTELTANPGTVASGAERAVAGSTTIRPGHGSWLGTFLHSSQPFAGTEVTGVVVAFAAAFLPVGRLADISNSGTLFAFAVVSVAVLVLRRTQPDRHRPFKTPLIWLFAPLSVAGCAILFAFLPWQAQLLFPVWSVIGLLFYFAYGYRHSHVGKGLTDVPEAEIPGPISN